MFKSPLYGLPNVPPTTQFALRLKSNGEGHCVSQLLAELPLLTDPTSEQHTCEYPRDINMRIANMFLIDLIELFQYQDRMQQPKTNMQYKSLQYLTHRLFDSHLKHILIYSNDLWNFVQ